MLYIRIRHVHFVYPLRLPTGAHGVRVIDARFKEDTRRHSGLYNPQQVFQNITQQTKRPKTRVPQALRLVHATVRQAPARHPSPSFYSYAKTKSMYLPRDPDLGVAGGGGRGEGVLSACSWLASSDAPNLNVGTFPDAPNDPRPWVKAGGTADAATEKPTGECSLPLEPPPPLPPPPELGVVRAVTALYVPLAKLLVPEAGLLLLSVAVMLWGTPPPSPLAPS